MRKIYGIILLFVLSATMSFAQNAVTVSGGEANGNSGSVSYDNEQLTMNNGQSVATCHGALLCKDAIHCV